MSGVLQQADVPAHLPIVLRPMLPTDRGFVVMTWMHSSYGRRATGPTDRNGQKRLANALIDRCPVTIAGWDKDPSMILGWCCTSRDVVHYVWVRGSDTEVDADGNRKPGQDLGYRRLGMASYLLRDYLPRSGIIYTHSPSFMWQRKRSHTVKAVFDSNRTKNPTPHQADPNSKDSGILVSVPGVPATWQHDPYLAFEVAATVPEYSAHHSPTSTVGAKAIPTSTPPNDTTTTEYIRGSRQARTGPTEEGSR